MKNEKGLVLTMLSAQYESVMQRGHQTSSCIFKPKIKKKITRAFHDCISAAPDKGGTL